MLDLGVETSLRIDRPMQLGQIFDVRCAFVDVASGTYKLADAGRELEGEREPETEPETETEPELEPEHSAAAAAA